MTEITPARVMIEIEQTRFRSAVSEALMQSVGASINFINTYEKFDKAWFINGKYNALTIPFDAIDGITFVPDNAVITNAFMFVHTAGSGGSTTLDIKYATAPGGSWTTIFTTKPSISSAAGSFAWCYTGSAFSNTTAPVLSVTNLTAGWGLRCDITAAQTGSVAGCGLVLFLRPR